MLTYNYRYCDSSYPGGYRQRRGRLDIRGRAGRSGYWGDSCRWDGCGGCSWRRGHIHCLPILIQLLVGRPICCSYLLEALLFSASLFSNDLQMAASFCLFITIAAAPWCVRASNK